MTRASLSLPILIALFASSPAGAQPQVVDVSYETDDGGRVLCHAAVVEAPPDEVWAAFTSPEGLRSFVAPVATIELAVGGRWEASYDPSAEIGDPANIVNEILSYVPGRMLSIRVSRTPPDFPHPDVVRRVWTVIELEPVHPGRTRVVTSMIGWRSGPAWDRIYEAFERDNAIVLRRLQERFRSGPIDWASVYAEEATP